jgi:hypothetical protein
MMTVVPSVVKDESVMPLKPRPKRMAPDADRSAATVCWSCSTNCFPWCTTMVNDVAPLVVSLLVV